MSKTPESPFPQKSENMYSIAINTNAKVAAKTKQETQLSIDHIIPLARGGSNDISKPASPLYHLQPTEKPTKLEPPLPPSL
jgi:hypothetical protein